MMRGPLLPWILLALWAAWLLALQGLLAQRLGAWTPDLGVVLLLALVPRLGPEQLPALALVLGLARCGVSVDPPAAILAGVLGIAALVGMARGVLQLESPAARSLFAALGALLLALWLEGVARVRLPESDVLPTLWLLSQWRLALATGACAPLLAPLLVRLPGLTPLRRRRAWPRAVSARWS